MTNLEKIRMFRAETRQISNKDVKSRNLRKFVLYMLTQIPDYIYEIPASSTGKYHAPEDLGEGGLVRHIKKCVYTAYTLLNLETFTYNTNDLDSNYLDYKFATLEKDLIYAALILHDGLKSGLENCGHTTSTHPIDMANFILTKYDDFIQKYGQKNKVTTVNIVADLIETHSGQWNKDREGNEVMRKPTTDLAHFVHLCDYIASRRFIRYDMDSLVYRKRYNNGETNK